MPARETTPAGAPSWVDLMTSDIDRSRAFYTELFGWDATEPNEDFGGYMNYSKGGVLVAGCFPRMPETPADVPDVWSVYLAVDDAEKTVEAAAAAGASVIAPAMAVGDLGKMAVLSDPTGASVGLWEAGTHKGMGAVADPDTPGWFELHTRDFDTAVGFYRDVFGWDTHEVGPPEFRYTTLGEGDDAMAGVMDGSNFLPEGVPAHWKVYFAVDDTDATVAKATSLGATVVSGAEDTPYGRLAVVSDPTGAEFSLIGPNESMPAR
jgi:predicted enzyme related to lactoylglutathione lyase